MAELTRLELADLLHAQLSRNESYLQVPRKQAELIYQNLRSADEEIARLKELVELRDKQLEGEQDEHDREYIPMSARVEKAEAALAKTQMNAHSWMRCHDTLLGFVQNRPELLRELLAHDPRPPFPSPADLPKALAEMRRTVEEPGVELIEHLRDKSGQSATTVKTILAALARHLNDTEGK